MTCCSFVSAEIPEDSSLFALAAALFSDVLAAGDLGGLRLGFCFGVVDGGKVISGALSVVAACWKLLVVGK